MPTPFMAQGADGGWLARIDSLLTNGRAPLYLQMPMLLIWYAALLHLSACAGFCAACHLQRMLPSVDGRLCAALGVPVSEDELQRKMRRSQRANAGG